MAGDREDADVETSSEDYAQRFAGTVGEFFLAVQARTTLALLAPRAAVLEVGGGHGQLTGALVDAGHEVTVFGSRDVCRERVRPWVDTGRARFQAGDLLRLPFGDGSFDVALAFRLLPHVTRWADLVGELCRVTRSVVIVDYPTRRSLNALGGTFFGLKKGLEGNTRPFTVFRDFDVVEAFEAHGFEPGARRPQFFFPMALHRALGVAPISRVLESLAGVTGLTHAFGSPVILEMQRRG